MLKRIAVTIALVAGMQSAFAQDTNALLGVWKLVSFDTEIQASGERRAAMGGNSDGYLIFTREGRMMGILVGGGRKAAQNDAERAALFRTMISYSGMYRVEGDKFTTRVDVSWNEAWTGTDQVRFFKLDGDRLDIISAWGPSVTVPGNPMVRGILTWRRVQH